MNLIRPFVLTCLAGASLQALAQTAPSSPVAPVAPVSPVTPQSVPAPAGRAAPAEAPVIDEIAVIVNNGMVTRREVLDRAAQIEAQLRGERRPVPERMQIVAEAMDQLVLERIQVQEATEAGITVPDADLERIVGQIAQQNNVSVDTLRVEVEKNGLKWAKYREQLRREVQIARLRDKEVISKIQVYDNEIDAFIAERTGRAMPAGDEYRIEQILIPVPEGASAERVAAARERAATLLKQIRDGAEFPRPSSVSTDIQVSDLGYRSAERLPKLFLDAVNGLKPGELVAEPVQSPAGWHVLKLTDKRRAGMTAIKVPQTQLRQIMLRVGDGQMTETEARRRLAALAERIRNGGNFGELARQFSQDPGSAPRGGELGWASAGELPPEMEAAIRDVKPGDLAEPVRSPNGMHLIQVLGRREAEVTAEQQREFARAALRERKVEQAVRDWLRQLRENAYVDYRVGRG